jgi:tetratricopeptide (TPR) repeat protein
MAQMPISGRVVTAVWVLCLLSCPAVAAQSAPKAGAAGPRTTQPAPARPQKPPARPSTFDAFVTRAGQAREAGQLDDALALYAKAIKMRPSWIEGYWFSATINYELDRYEPARDGFRRVTQLSPENGPAWTFMGLCEFQLKNYEEALGALLHGRSIGTGANKELVSVARYHLAILLTRTENYEQALQLLWDFAREGDDGPKIIEAMGIAALRMPLLPAEVPGTKREQIMLAGRAAYLTGARFSAAAQKAFEELVSRYPDSPNVHYAYAVFLTLEHPDEAIEQYKAELAVSPRHTWAKMQLAFEYIKRGDYEAARPYAEQAVQEAPNVFVARRALGQVLLETGDVEGAVREYEAGVQLSPESPAMRFALARAYRRAGRVADAQREQAEFARLDRIARTERAGAQSVGGMEMEPAQDSKPPEPQQP